MTFEPVHQEEITFTFFENGNLLDTLLVSPLKIGADSIDTSETLSQGSLRMNNYTSSGELMTIGGVWVNATQELHIPVVTTFGTYIHYDATEYLSISLYETLKDGGDALITSGSWSGEKQVSFVYVSVSHV